MVREVGIAGTGHYVPEKVLSNFDLEKMVDTSDEWIFTRTGMRERRIAADDEACSDLCYHASAQALEDAGMEARELDMIVVATVTPDQLLPSTAAFLQDRLGAVNAGGWDINNACTGFLSAMMTAHGMIAAGTADNVLIVGAEVLSRILNYQDRTSCILFGDGAGAMVLKADHPQGRIIFNSSGIDGSMWESIQRSAGGSRRPMTHERLEQQEHMMTLKGNEVFKFAVGKFRSLIQQSLDRTGHTTDDLAHVVPHQGQFAHHRGGAQEALGGHGTGLRQSRPLRKHVGCFDSDRFRRAQTKGSRRIRQPDQFRRLRSRPRLGLGSRALVRTRRDHEQASDPLSRSGCAEGRHGSRLRRALSRGSGALRPGRRGARIRHRPHLHRRSG